MRRPEPADETQSKIVNDTLGDAVADALAELPGGSVESQVRAAALFIAETCAEDLARAGAAAPWEARPPGNAPIAQVFLEPHRGERTEATANRLWHDKFDLIE